MKTVSRRMWLGIGMILLAAVRPATAQLTPPGGGSLWPTNTPLDSWSFNDTTNWTSDDSYAPISFTNIESALFGDGTSLIVSNQNPAWIGYNVVESGGATNLAVGPSGTLAFWVAPLWASSNAGGTGPGTWARLISVGDYSSNGLPGWWAVYTDPAGTNLFFTVQPGDGTTSNYLSSPISWSSNYWHFAAITYSPSNTEMYLDGISVATNVGLVSWPGTNVLAGGMFIGSTTNGSDEALAAFDDIYTYNVPLDGKAIGGMYNYLYPEYYLSPWNFAPNFSSAPSSPSANPAVPDFITGPGYLQWVGSTATCSTNTNADIVWLTNITTTVSGTNVTVTFSIEGGQDGYAYDVFATPTLEYPIANAVWAWMGQGETCNTYELTNLGSSRCYLILGTPKDSAGDGITDAYSDLVVGVSPSLDGTFDGLPVAWMALNGLTSANGLPGMDPDSDGLNNMAEYLYGTKPLVSEGFDVWVNPASLTSGIP